LSFDAQMFAHMTKSRFHLPAALVRACRRS
jgi:hypothetical protein